jgi:two-component system copper resistance phosphate regulon response regulator CusR
MSVPMAAGHYSFVIQEQTLKILVVEDEPKAAEYLRQGLSESGYAVEVANNGTDGLHLAASGDHDLVILDVMLPGIDGFAVLSALRTSRQVPVLMLTARERVDDKVRGFDLGADDYLVKPFQFPELLARVRALLKRNQSVPADPVVRVADLEIDPVRHRATRNGRRIDLSAKEFALLSLLAQRAGQVLSRTQIASLVWDIHFDSETNVVEVAVRRLRAKIDDPFEEKLIHTVRGVGYVLERRG